jgi:Zinc knuckle.
MHTVKEMELLAAKLDLLMKLLDDHEKRPQGSVKALDSHVICEVCGNTGHSGNDCPETREEAMYMGNNNTGIVHKEVKGGTNHAHIIKEATTTVIFLTSPP